MTFKDLHKAIKAIVSFEGSVIHESGKSISIKNKTRRFISLKSHKKLENSLLYQVFPHAWEERANRMSFLRQKKDY